MSAAIRQDLPLAALTVSGLVFAVADTPCISPCSVLQPYAAEASGPPPLSAALLQQLVQQQLLPLLWPSDDKHQNRLDETHRDP